MSGFVRVKLVGYELPPPSKPSDDTFIAVKIKEAKHTENGGMDLVQSRRTLNLEWNAFFDSHLYDGRVIQIILMLRPSKISIADVSIGVQILCGYCKNDWSDVTLDLNPTGKILLHVRHFQKEDSKSGVCPELENSSYKSIAKLPSLDPTICGDDDEEDLEVYGIAQRRCAMRQPKILEFRGHRFIETFFKSPTFCTYCSEFIWGLNKQGFKCQTCICAVHKKCYDRLLGQCPGSAKDSEDTKMMSERFNVNVPHRFEINTFLSPTFCDHCGTMLFGLFRQGYKCEECGVNCHKKCQNFMPNLCGVNQKILNELLDTVKRSNLINKKAPTPKTTIPENSAEDIYSSVYDVLGSDLLRLSIADITSSSSDSESVKNSNVDKNTTLEPWSVHRSGIRSRPQSRIVLETTVADYDNYGSEKTLLRNRSTTVKTSTKKFKIEDFNFTKVLGKGSFGKVLLAELKGSTTNEMYAVKALRKDIVLEDNDVDCTMIERRILELGSQNHYLAHLHSTFQTDTHLFFVMEFLNGGDLMFHIQYDKKFKEDRARFYAAEMICGLQFLHKKGVVYRDLKPDNVLLDKDGHVKIADFGMCKENIYGDNRATTFCGTPHYLAPEIIRGEPYNESVDWFSFGVVLYEMLEGRLPFHGRDEDEMFNCILHENAKPHKHIKSDSPAAACIRLLLDKKADTRLGMPGCPAGAIRNHAFFRVIDWNLLEQRKLEPQFKPKVKSGSDVRYFDTEFTREAARLSEAADKCLLASMDQCVFEGFSFTSPMAAKK